MQRSTVLLVGFLLGGSIELRAAQTGDFDGDGILTIGDVRAIFDRAEPELAPGSLDAFREYPSYGAWKQIGEQAYEIGPSVLLESLRRFEASAYPVPSPKNYDPAWAELRPQAPPAADSMVFAHGMSSIASADGAVRISVILETDVSIRAFALVVDSTDGLLQVPWVRNFELWRVDYWGSVGGILGDTHSGGDIPVHAPPMAHLVTAGKYVMIHGLQIWPELLSPGSYLLEGEGRLRKGTEPGSYPLWILPSSQILLGDGSVVAPTIDKDAESEIVVTAAVTEGWSQPFPRLDFDAVEHKIRGPVEFRLVHSTGRVPADGEPLAEALPGEEVPVVVQVRTAIALNRIRFELRWPPGSIYCTEFHTPMLEDGETGELAKEAQVSLPCSAGFDTMYAEYNWGSNWAWVVDSEERTNFPRRALAYFGLLDQWVDVLGLSLLVPESAGSGDVPIVFEPSEDSTHPDAEYAPYRPRHYGEGYPGITWPDRPAWGYDVRRSGAFIRIPGDQPPVDGPDLGLAVIIGRAFGTPGDTVEVPIVAFARVPLVFHRLALELDSTAIEVEEVGTVVRSTLTGEEVRLTTQKGERKELVECPRPDEPCRYGSPWQVWYRPVEDPFVLIEWTDLAQDGFHYPGPSPREIARLRVRISDDAPGGEAFLRPAAFDIVEENGFTVPVLSGGREFGQSLRVPISSTRVIDAGGVTVVSGQRFERGDVNQDSMIDLSDAVAALNHLFLGGPEPPCRRAADANDDGKVDISDPVMILGALFLGVASIPPPAECGLDPTPDGMDCKVSTCN